MQHGEAPTVLAGTSHGERFPAPWPYWRLGAGARGERALIHFARLSFTELSHGPPAHSVQGVNSMNGPFDRDEILIRALRILQEELTATDKIVSAHGRAEH